MVGAAAVIVAASVANVGVAQTVVREGETYSLDRMPSTHFATSFTVSWTVVPGTADSSDYSPQSGSFTVPAQGNPSLPLQPIDLGDIVIADDGIAEPDETFQISYEASGENLPEGIDLTKIIIHNNPQNFVIKPKVEAPPIEPVQPPAEPEPSDPEPDVEVLVVETYTGPVWGDGPHVREILETAQPGETVGDPIPLDDPGKGEVTYSLAGPDEHLFDIDDNAQIIVADGAAFDYETDNRLVVRVTAKDKGGDTATATVIIHVLDVNEPPVLGDFDLLEVSEDAPAGKTVGNPASADDPEGDEITYSLVGDDTYPFVIDPKTGQISVAKRPVKKSAENPGLDYESKTTHTFTVVATDPDGASHSRQATVRVKDIAPAFADVDRLEVAENAPGGRLIGEPIAAHDPGDNAVAYRLTAPNAPLDIHPVTGQLALADDTALDFETESSYAITVHATVGKRSTSINLTVHVTDIGEPPGPPGTPTLVQVGSDTLNAQWTAADASGRPPVTLYELQYRRRNHDAPGDWRTVTTAGAELTRLLDGLASNTPYEARVRAHNDEGISEWSGIGHGTTALAQLAVRFSAGEASLVEGGGTTVTVLVSPAADRHVTVSIKAAEPIGELAGIPTTVSFRRGAAAATFDVTAGQDDFDAQDFSTLLVFGDLPEHVARSEPSTVRVTVIDDDKIAADRMRRLNVEILGRQALAIMTNVSTAIVDRTGDTSPEEGTLHLPWGRMRATAGQRLAAMVPSRRTSPWDILDGASFSLPFAGSGHSPWRAWGLGSYQSLDAPAGALQWDGHLSGAQVGLDREFGTSGRGGFAASWSQGDFEYEDSRDHGNGTLESTFASAHPYIGRHSPNGLSWGTVGYGKGDVSIRDEGRAEQSSDLRFGAASVGGRRHLASGNDGSWRLDVQADATFARVDVHGQGLIAEDTIEVSRMRVALAGTRRWTLGEHSVISDMELGARRDGGFTGDGSGAEVGAGVAYFNRAAGLTVEGRGRALLFAPVDEWGLQGLVRVDPGSDSLGLSVMVRPTWGTLSGGVHQLWNEGLSSLGTGKRDTAPRVTAEFGYGVLHRGGVVTPYAAFRHGRASTLRIGSRYDWLDRLSVRIESERRQRLGNTENAFLLQLVWARRGAGVWPIELNPDAKYPRR